jgi:protein-tyrosine phosphatase
MNQPAEDIPNFSVLIVCTANQCRSPIAEHLLRASLESIGVDWAVSSAGTHARGGGLMDPSAAVLLGERGIDVAGWRSSALDIDVIDRADLILTAEAKHRSRVVTFRPNALARTFPLLQFSRIARHIEALDDPGGPAAGDTLLEHVLMARSHVQPGQPGDDDIADPIGRRMRAFRACLETISGAVTAITGPLAGARDLTS